MSITPFPTSDIPAVTGNSGKVLTTDGYSPSWGSGSGMTLLGSVGASGNLVSITNIDQSYRDLRLVGVDIQTSGSSSCLLRVNGITGTSYYPYSYFLSNATSAISHTTSSDGGYFMFAYAGGKCTSITDIYNYASTSKNVKPWISLSDMDNTSSYRYHGWGAFNATSNTNDGVINITSIGMYNSNTWTGGTFYLYGVK